MHRTRKLSRAFPSFALLLHLHIVLFQHTQQVRLSVQRFARQRNERDNPLRPVVLQGAGSDLQYPAYLFPRQVHLAVHHRVKVRRYVIHVLRAPFQSLEVRLYLFHVLCNHFHLILPLSVPCSMPLRTLPHLPACNTTYGLSGCMPAFRCHGTSAMSVCSR